MKQNTQNNKFPKLGALAERALAQAGYVRLEQLTKVTEVELGRLHSMGPTPVITCLWVRVFRDKM